MPRHRLLLILLVAALSEGPRLLIAQSHSADSAAILRIVQQRAEANRTRNAEMQRANYAPDAIWINAFGARQSGRDSIVAFLRGLYADPGYRESRVTREDPPEVVFIRPDVAIVHEFLESEGQRLADGTVISRRTHTTLVISKERGRWLIQYQYIGDERPHAAPR
ncbi:MAG TPA: SgcJ/EcaC family oxidoreductase [Gemmatimonadaceae bacterium]|nr:SgcJ/EcaC family oxidoreductase [Gemmatimonadaceae bacterium]